MGILSRIGDFASSISRRDVVGVVAVVVCILLFRQCAVTDRLRDQARLNEQNAAALVDSIRTERENHGRTYNAYRTLSAAEMSDLKQINRALYDRIDSLRRVRGVRGRLAAVTSIGGVIASPGTTVPAEVLYVSASGEVRTSFEIDTTYSEHNSRRLTGHMDFHLDSMEVSNARFTVDTDVVNVGLTTGITKDGRTYKIFVSSDYPGFRVSSLDGAVLDPKMLRSMSSDESSVVVGPFLGYGYGFGSVNSTPIVGLGVTYNLNKSIKGIFRR